MNEGIQNEINFVDFLNGKRIYELNPMFINFLESIFTNLKENDKLVCLKNNKPQKHDIIIRIGLRVRRISIKKGIKNSVHVERISDFIHFLIMCGMKADIINSYLYYHYADGTRNGKGKNRISSAEFQEQYPNVLKKLNKAFSDEKFILKAINRFVIQGKNSVFKIDAIISGTPDDFMWISRKDIININIKHRNMDTKGLHIGGLFVQPQDRCLNYNSRYNRKRYCVQLKWYHLSDDIIEIMNDNKINK